jgi:hypothetical protein
MSVAAKPEALKNLKWPEALKVMNKTLLNIIVTVTLLLLATTSSHAQSSAQYYNEIKSLNPVGYWPMHETNAPAPGDIETNYGSLGVLANAYYPDWEPNPTTTAFARQNATVPFANDTNKCLSFLVAVNTGAVPGPSGLADAWFTNALYIPRISSQITLITNYTVECWFYNIVGVPQSGIYKGVELFAEDGADDLNGTGPSAGGGVSGGGGDGMTINWNGGWFASALDQYGGAGPGAVGDTTPSSDIYLPGGFAYTTNHWLYITLTCDANTNWTFYLNGVNLQSGSTANAQGYIPDSWTPFWIGGGRGGTRSMAGWMTAFAIYTNCLGGVDIFNRYQDATNAANTNAYYRDVTNDNPVVYYKLNAPNYTAPAVSTWPVAANLGSVPSVGVYTPGTVPGILAGPNNPSGLTYAGVTNNAAMLSGISSFVDVTNPAAAYNVTGSNANFSVTALFRGNPCDGRFNSIISHGVNSWQLAVSTNGQIVFNAGNGVNYGFDQGGDGVSPGDLHTVGNYNDANWHQVVVTCQTNFVSIYVDGNLDTNGYPAGVTSTNFIPGNNLDVMIGDDPSYTNYPVGVGRAFAGQISEVAFFNNVLTLGQVTNLYNDLGVAPYITTQPVSQSSLNAGTAYTNTITAGGTASLYYQWFTNGVAFGGQTNASLVLNPATGNESSADYYVVVTNNFGSATSAVASVAIYTAPTVFGEYPVTYNSAQNTNHLTIYAGAHPSFSISAQGQSLAYYWFTNGVAVGGANNYNFTYTNTAQIGSFTVSGVVSNFVDAVTSVVWSASVIADPPTNGVGFAPYPQAVLALHPIGYWRLNEAEIGNGDDGVIATDYAGGNDGLYTNVYLGDSQGGTGYNPTTDPSDTSVWFGAYFVNNCDANGISGSLGNGIDVATPAGNNGEFSVECWVFFAQDKFDGLVSKGWLDGGEEFSLGSTNGTSNPGLVVRTANGTPYAASGTFTPVVNTWYHFCGICDEANGLVSFYVNGVLEGTTAIPSNSGILYDNVEGMVIGAEPSQSNFAAAGNNDKQANLLMNDVAVFNYALTGAQVANQYIQAAFPPFIGAQPPALQYAARGSSPTITADVSGSLPLTYIWYETNVTTSAITPVKTNVITSGLPGTTTLTITGITTNSTYFLTTTNAFGITNTSASSIIVYSNPLIIAESPITQTNSGNTSFMKLYPGGSPTFSIYALGLVTGATAQTTNSYTWFTNGVSAGLNQSSTSINTTYLVTNAQQSFNIYCVLSNSFGAVTSTVWSVTVVPLPQAFGGGTAVYPQQVMALHPVSYWRLNEADDGLSDGNPGRVAYDYAAGNNGIYTNTLLGNTGTNQYNPVEDPSGTSAQFGYFNSAINSMVAAIGTNLDFTSPLGTNQGLTVECWVNWWGFSKGALVSKGQTVGNGPGGNNEFELVNDYTAAGANPASLYPLFAAHTANNANPYGGGGNIVSNQWYHLVGVVDEVNNLLTFYVDGEFAGSFGMGGNTGIESLSEYNLLIGAASSSAANQANGVADSQSQTYISDVAIFNYALTVNQVLNQYLVGGAVPVSFNPAPPTTWTTNAGQTLVIPVTAQGTPPLGFVWTNLTTGAAIVGASGTINNSGLLNASLIYPNVPISWNGDTLEVTVTNAYGPAAIATIFLNVGVNLNPTNIVSAVTNNQLYLSWPSDHTGWQLQAQTNSVSAGIKNNWVNVSGSTTTNLVVVPVNLANGCVFYRLVYP